MRIAILSIENRWVFNFAPSNLSSWAYDIPAQHMPMTVVLAQYTKEALGSNDKSVAAILAQNQPQYLACFA